MRQNVTYSIGNIALIEKVNEKFGFFDSLFDGVFGRAKEVKETAKALAANRLGACVSTHRLTEVYPKEFFLELGFNDIPAERNLYRNIERVGFRCPVLLERYQRLVKKNCLVTKEQFVDFSSSYFEGKKAPLGALGYSRDGQPGKKQLVFGISTGINEVPSALTIQKGNVQDKKHFRVMLRTVSKVLEPESMVIFDCGGNTRANKQKVRELGFHYLTLKAKKRVIYKQYLRLFKKGEKQKVKMGETEYECVKAINGEETNYIFYSEKLKKDQLRKKKKKFKRELDKNDRLLPKVARGKDLEKLVTRKGYVVTKGLLQKTLKETPNPYITGLEGFFILESSIDAEPKKILALYKDRDKAEKLIRNMKEGTELRPMRHWSKLAVIGYLFIVFLTNCLHSLTLFLTKNPLVKNVKLLKKYLNSLTLTIVYPKKALQLRLLSNISTVTTAIFGDFIHRYGSVDIDLRW